MFFEKYPNAILYVEGSSEQRMKVYLGLIKRSWGQIEPFYNISGSTEGEIIDFQPNTAYEFVLISKKAT